MVHGLPRGVDGVDWQLSGNVRRWSSQEKACLLVVDRVFSEFESCTCREGDGGIGGLAMEVAHG